MGQNIETLPKSKYFILSTAQGCVSNLLETTTLRKSLNSKTVNSVSTVEQADVVIVNTCGYNDEAEARAIKTITDLQSRFPDKRFVVGGCLPGINEAKVKSAFQGDILKIGEWGKLNKILAEPVINTEKLQKEAAPLDDTDLGTRLPINRFVQYFSPLWFRLENIFGRKLNPVHNILRSLTFDSQTYVISVAKGCLGKCTYCAIKIAKGDLVSRRLDEILREFQIGLRDGFQKFHLSADDIGCWGQDINLDVSDLLNSILKINKPFELVIEYFDPAWFSLLFPKLERLMSDPRIICANIPIQSGSTDLVKKMGRKYSVPLVLDQIKKIKDQNPTLVVKTHFMIAYPDESPGDFLETLKSVRYFDLIFPNLYSPRPGTIAADRRTQLSQSERIRRYRKLKLEILKQHLRSFFSSLYTR